MEWVFIAIKKLLLLIILLHGIKNGNYIMLKGSVFLSLKNILDYLQVK